MVLQNCARLLDKAIELDKTTYENIARYRSGNAGDHVAGGGSVAEHTDHHGADHAGDHVADHSFKKKSHIYTLYHYVVRV